MTARADLDAVMQLVLERSQSLTGAEGAMVNFVEGEDLVTRAASGIAVPTLGRRRPLASAVARYAIEDGIPVPTTMDECEDDAVIVGSTIDLGRNLGLAVVVEGVESEAVWSHLKSLGCTAAQGYRVGPA